LRRAREAGRRGEGDLETEDGLNDHKENSELLPGQVI
jgi:hypothetical protein